MSFNHIIGGVLASAVLWQQCLAATRDEYIGGNLVDASVREIPSIGLGTWLSERDKVGHAVEFALDDGYRHIDAAAAYSNEDRVGEGISTAKEKRKEIWVTSKLWNTDHRPDDAHKAIDKTISDLGVDYLDLYLMHWPVAFVPESKDIDSKTSIIDTWRAMEDMVRENKTRYIGISNFAPHDINDLLRACDICPYAHEFETHPYLQQQDFVDWHLEHDIRVIAYSPLANTNPHYESGTDAILKDPFWRDLADKKDATVPQAILAWGQQRNTIVIPKSVHEEYIHENLGSVEISFTREELNEIREHDKKLRFNNPGKEWGVSLFEGLDDPVSLAVPEDEL